MDERGIIVIIIAIVGVLLTLLAWASLSGLTGPNGQAIIPGNNWDEVAQGVTYFAVAIAVFAICVGSIVILVKRH